MKLLSLGRAMTAMFISMCVSAAIANRYTITDLGAGETPVAVNRVSVVAGNVESGNDRGKVFRGDKWHNLPIASQAWAINRAGDVAGVDLASNLPMLWPHNDETVPIKLPQGAIAGTAFGLNNSGQAVGYYETPDGSAHCYLWSLADGAQDLGYMQNGNDCTGWSINSLGQVAGEASIQQFGPPHAFIWTGDHFTDLGLLAGLEASVGLDINDGGQVVGYGTDGRVSRAFWWDGELIDLDPMHEFQSSQALAINNSNEIVGWVQQSGSGHTAAVRFAHSKVLRLASEVLNIGDWKLSSAVSINDKGVIVGSGTISGGQPHAFMLVPQKP